MNHVASLDCLILSDACHNDMILKKSYDLDYAACSVSPWWQFSAHLDIKIKSSVLWLCFPLLIQRYHFH